MSQAAFATALLDLDAAVPSGLCDPFGQPAPKRFSVYRNNVAASLTRTLEAAFPTVQKLVGEAFFGATAREFLRNHPPRSPRLMNYGDAFPAWLEGFARVAHLGYLPDVARLDQAMRESYHSADALPIPAAVFQKLLTQDIAGLRLAIAPAVRLVRSPWPIHAIWLANHVGGPVPLPAAQDVLVLRPVFDPRPHALGPGGGSFVAGLMLGLTLGECIDRAGPKLDLAAILGLLITGQAIIGVSE